MKRREWTPMGQQAKAVVAGGVAGFSFLAAVASDGISLVDGLGCVAAVLAGWQATYWTDNDPA